MHCGKCNKYVRKKDFDVKQGWLATNIWAHHETLFNDESLVSFILCTTQGSSAPMCQHNCDMVKRGDH